MPLVFRQMHQLVDRAKSKNKGKSDKAAGRDVDQAFRQSFAQQSIDGGTGRWKERNDPNELQKVHSSPKTWQGTKVFCRLR